LLNRIKLTNFQRHRSLEVVFNGGLTALRGANEAGKSSLLRAICYALFGVKGLGATLEELVTWGEDVRTLKVELELNIENVLYSVKRGKSGAELTYDGGTVTGQNEVTAFVCRLLRCDAASATRLILANQNEIRGALEAGATKTTELIERLAEFDQIDNLIETIQEKLTLGSTGNVEAAIAAAEKQLDAAREAAVAPDLNALDDAIERASMDLDILTGDAGDAQDNVDKAVQAYNDGKVAAKERKSLLASRDEASKRLGDIDTELAQLRAVTAPDNAGARIEALRAEIAAAEDRGELRSKYTRVEKHMGPRPSALPYEGFFDGSIEKLENTIELLRAAQAGNGRVATEHTNEAKLLRQQITAGSCTFCGQDFSNVPEVKAKNASLLAQAQTHEQKAREATGECSRASSELERLQAIREASKPALKVLDVVGDLAELQDDLLPPVLVWAGPKVDGPEVDHAALRRQIKEIEDAQRAYDRASAKIETLGEERERLSVRLAEVSEHLGDYPEVDVAALQAAVEAARDALRPVQAKAQEAAAALTAAQRQKEDAVAAYERAKSAVEAAKAALKQRRSELDELEFNNALLKRVRQCRPMIADQLWNLVLNAVSTYFSEMRGVKSRVRKNGEGFTVDGHVVGAATMSGSTLDVLGLAIRVALVRTFLPAAPFLILDEPAAACDDGRTSNLLGFLAGCGFKQVLLVTHEDISEAVADNMITL
jgi:DNA repair exonuclease SbcCD ATPase subunit